MKVVFDTNIYISWIRENKHSSLMLNPYTQKYLSCIVLMELWAGVKNKKSSRTIERLQSPYIKAKRIITFSTKDFIVAGQTLSDLPEKYKNKINKSSFINDMLITLNATSLGAILYTENKHDFDIISKYIKGLKVRFV